MTKELTHRGSELSQLGWSQNDVMRYIDLWDYRQRWGAINLEREDRLFLRKAESVLPEVKTTKTTPKKPIYEKSYFCRILFFITEMSKAESNLAITANDLGLWRILLEEELRTLAYFEPVLGLPDTLKAKALIQFREELVSSLVKKYKEDIQNHEFDFNTSLEVYNESENKSWQPLRDGITENINSYPILPAALVEDCRNSVRSKTLAKIRNTFPSLAESDKADPPDDWIPQFDY